MNNTYHELDDFLDVPKQEPITLSEIALVALTLFGFFCVLVGFFAELSVGIK